ncbi:MAG: DUF616 domain-containing protein [Sneathiella sp.]|nr:DUF616 domain-containing protein [Sneathiella sp.]
MKDYIVYTCITNNYDWLLPPLYKDPRINYLCFTDTPGIFAEGWTVLPISSSLKHLPPNLINRHYKFFPHLYLPDSEWSVYIDGNIRILGNFMELIEHVRNKGAVMACPAHPSRNNIYDEATACFQLNKFSEKDLKVIEKQLAEYSANGMPENVPLTANYVIIRAHRDDRVQEAMELWWTHLRRYSQRDQISLPYVIWKKNVPFTVLEDEGMQSICPKYFIRTPHRRPGLQGVFNYFQARRFDGKFWKLLSFAAQIAEKFKRTLITKITGKNRAL